MWTKLFICFFSLSLLIAHWFVYLFRVENNQRQQITSSKLCFRCTVWINKTKFSFPFAVYTAERGATRMSAKETARKHIKIWWHKNNKITQNASRKRPIWFCHITQVSAHTIFQKCMTSSIIRLMWNETKVFRDERKNATNKPCRTSETSFSIFRCE